MPFDGIVTSSITYGLSQKLTGGRIEKIYQPDADELILFIHSGRSNYKLLISSGSSHPRLHLVTTNKSNPQNPMAFCMLLRKHIQSGRIVSIMQRESERIVEISIESFNEMGFSVSKKLLIEIMGKHSNIILIDNDTNKIIDSIKRIHSDVNRYRQVLPGFQYVYPPLQGKVSYFNLTLSGFNQLFINTTTKSMVFDEAFNPESAGKTLVSAIQGISPVIARDLCNKSSSIKELFDYLMAFIEKIGLGAFSPHVYLNSSGAPVDFYCFELTEASAFYQSMAFDDIQQAAEYFYANRDSSNKMKQKSMDLIRALGLNLEKLYLKKQKLSSDLLEAEGSEIYKLFGELITANMYAIKPKAAEISVTNYYNDEMVMIVLDPRLSASQNAQRYFKKYAKSKTAILEKTIQLEEADKDIRYLESVLAHVENADSYEDIEEIRQEVIDGGYMKKRKNAYKVSKSKPAPYTYLSRDGFKILVGRNNKENDVLTFKTAGNKDIWLHTKDIPGSHVIILTEGRDIPDTTLKEAASIAAYYSKARLSENVAVDYTQVRHVKKPAGAKPGMVIFVHNKTLFVNPKLES